MERIVMGACVSGAVAIAAGIITMVAGAMAAVSGTWFAVAGRPVLAGVFFGLAACAGFFAVQTACKM